MARERNQEGDYPAHRIGQQWPHGDALYAEDGHRPVRKGSGAAYCDKPAYFSNEGAHGGE